jgi:hypothetical protein
MAIAIAAFVVGCSSTAPRQSSSGAIVTAGPNGTPSERAAPSSSAFESTLYRYELVLPSGWLAHPAESTWTSGVLEGRCPSDWDCFSDNRNGVTLAAAAEAVPAGLSVDRWRSRIQFSTPEVCSDSGPRTNTTLDSEPAQAWTSTCSSEDLDVIKVVAIHGGRGYIILFASPTSIGLEADQATFDSIIAKFRFANS